MFPKSFICLTIALLGHYAVHAQDAPLQRILAAKEDTLQANQLIEYGRNLSADHPKQAHHILGLAMEKARRLDYTDGMGRVQLAVGALHTMSTNYRQAIDTYREAIFNFEKAAMPSFVAKCLNNIGVNYELMGKTDSAMNTYLLSIKALENTSERRALAVTYSNIGVLYGNAGNYMKAIAYKQKAVSIAQMANDPAILVEALTELADTYIEKGEPAKGLPLAYKALDMALVCEEKDAMGAALYTLSTALLGVGNTDSAILLAKECLKAAQTHHDDNTYMAGILALADGYNAKNAQQERYTILKEGITLAHKSGTVLILHFMYKRLADAASKLGRYEEAYSYQQQYMVYKDTMQNEKNTRIISELEMKYQTAEKEVMLQKSRQQTFYGIATTVVALLLAAVIYIHFNNRRKLHKRQLNALQQEQEIHRLQALMQGEEKERSRLAKELHDGIAAILSAVKMQLMSLTMKKEAQTYSEEYRQAVTLLDQAHEEIRKTSHNLMPEVLLKYGLDEALRRYCSNIKGHLDVQYSVYGDVQPYEERFELAIYRIVQELLGNVIKHAGATKAQVQVTAYEKLLMIEVADNGKGFSQVHVTTSIGLQSLQSRVQALGGTIHFDSRTTGLTATLEFDVTRYEQVQPLQAKASL